jgi:sugar fermentation stimulation protein A
MPLFRNTVQARFIARPNRFVVTADLDGRRVRAYLPNPGRLMEILFPGTRLWLEPSAVPGRRLKLTCVAAELGREVRSGRRRFDFLLEVDGEKMFLEVKSCTLLGGRAAMFPDARDLLDGAKA